MSFEIKNPVLMYEGILKKIKEFDNIGQSYFSSYQFTHSNNNTILKPFSQIFLNSNLIQITLLLDDQNLNPGDHIRIIDIKKNFMYNPLEVSPQSKKLDGGLTPKLYEISGSIIDFIYIDDDIGWISFIDIKSQSNFLSFKQYNIANATFDRHGLAVCQSKLPNTVELATAGSFNKVPIVGIVLKDNGTNVLVQTENIDRIGVQLSSDSIDPLPGQFVFLSDMEEGYITNVDPEYGIIHRIGRITQVISPVYVIINFFPKPEYIVSECDLFSPYGSIPFTKVSAGDGFQLVLDQTGHVWSYGANTFGQLGLGHTEDQDHPRRIDYPCPIWDISCGDNHSLLLDTNYDIWVMGDNRNGQLAIDITEEKILLPTKITVHTEITSGTF